MTDPFVLDESAGSITVTAAALSRLIVQAAEQVDGARVRRARRGLDANRPLRHAATQATLHPAGRQSSFELADGQSFGCVDPQTRQRQDATTPVAPVFAWCCVIVRHCSHFRTIVLGADR